MKPQTMLVCLLAGLVMAASIPRSVYAQDLSRKRIYDVPFVCGVITSNASPVVLGRYSTSISFQNKGGQEASNPIFVDGRLTLPYRAFLTSSDPDNETRLASIEIPNGYYPISIDCVDIANMYTTAIVNPRGPLPSFAEGHIHIVIYNYLPGDPFPSGQPPELDVSVVYTTRPEAGTNNGAQSIQTIQNIPSQVLESAPL